MRWAVAVREVRLQFGDLPGAIEAARAAVAVRPERQSLWREAADLLVRADRPREAAGMLEGWAKPRPADEEAARRRSELLARMGEGDKALAVERGALEAYAKEAPLDEAREGELKGPGSARRPGPPAGAAGRGAPPGRAAARRRPAPGRGSPVRPPVDPPGPFVDPLPLAATHARKLADRDTRHLGQLWPSSHTVWYSSHTGPHPG